MKTAAQLMEEGRQAEQKKERARAFWGKLFQPAADHFTKRYLQRKERDIELARAEMTIIQDAFQEITGIRPLIGIDTHNILPVYIKTGFSLAIPDWYIEPGTSPKDAKDFPYRKRSELIIRGRGRKIFLEAGNDLHHPFPDFLSVRDEPIRLEKRILAKGTANIVRRLGRMKFG